MAGAASEAGRITLADGVEGPSARAFAWGALGNVLEMDDVDKRAILHPGPTVVPAALALGEASGASGGAVLDALVRGYEAVIRLGRAAGPGHYKFWHSTGTCGPIGAAAACASLLELDREATAHALALAASQAAGFWQTRHEPASLGKQLHTSHAARAGLDAAQLAARGFRGPLSILEGPQGFFAATCPGADAEHVLADYGAGWLIHQVSFKPWPACRHAHAAIDAALAAGGPAAAGEVDAVEVATYADALAFCDKPAPESVIEAKFSLQHSVAVALIRGKPTLADFEPEAIADPELAALRAKIRVRTGKAYEDAYPARYGAGLTLRRQGAEETFEAPDALGDPENPISLGALAEKARTLMAAGGVGPSEADVLADAILALPQSGELANVLARLKAALS